MAVRSNDVYQPSPQQHVSEPFDASSEVAQYARCRDLAEHPPLNEIRQEVGVLLDRFSALWMGQYRRHTPYLELEKDLRGVVGMSEEWKLHQNVMGFVDGQCPPL